MKSVTYIKVMNNFLHIQQRPAANHPQDDLVAFVLDMTEQYLN